LIALGPIARAQEVPVNFAVWPGFELSMPFREDLDIEEEEEDEEDEDEDEDEAEPERSEVPKEAEEDLPL